DTLVFRDVRIELRRVRVAPLERRVLLRLDQQLTPHVRHPLPLDRAGLAEPGHRLQQHVPAPHLRSEVDTAAQVRARVRLAPPRYDERPDERTARRDETGRVRVGRIRGGDADAVVCRLLLRGRRLLLRGRRLLLRGQRRRQQEQQSQGRREACQGAHFPAPPAGARTGNAAGAIWTCT